MNPNPTFPNSAVIHAPECAVLRNGRWKRVPLAVRYGLFEHPVGGRCLIDTGYSNRVTTGRRSLALKLYTNALRPKLSDKILPAYAPDIDTILLSHLHADHVSALRDYPTAKIYIHGRATRHFLSLNRTTGLRHGVFTELLPDDLANRVVPVENTPQVEAPLGLGRGHDIFGDGGLLAIDLPGHMLGHTGFLWPLLNTPLLYAVDVQWHHRAIMENRPPGPPLKWIMNDQNAAAKSTERVAAFARAGGKVVYCHDPLDRA